MLIDDSRAEALTRSFLLGTARHPAPVGAALKSPVAGHPASELTALALLGQRLRFRRPGPPPERNTAAAIEDHLEIVPDKARVLMRRLVGSNDGSASDLAALALADACHRRRLRPHPFDLPRLKAFAKAHGESLGAYASAWTARGERTEEQQSQYFDAETLDDANWTAARPAARARFIAAMRAREPERARALVEVSFATEPAPVRAKLLDALATGLSATDMPFLEGLARDRAPSVRERAERLLKLIPGSASAEARLRELVERTKISSGLLRRRKALALELPANLQDSPHPTSAAGPARRWAVESYAGPGLQVMAAAFRLSVPDMISAASENPPLLALFARQASIERKFDVLATIVREHAADAWVDAIGSGSDDIPELENEAAVDQWCEAALVPSLWRSLPYPADLQGLYAFLRRPLPEPTARELLQSRVFAAVAHENSSAGTTGLLCLAIAALAPAGLRAELRVAFASFAADEISRAMLLLDCLTLVDPPVP